MAISTKVLVQPAGEPLSLDEAKLACRVDTDMSADDDFIFGLIRRARTYVEQTKAISLVSRTVLATWDRFPKYGFLSPFDCGLGWYGGNHFGQRAPTAEMESRTSIDRSSMRFPESPLQSATAIYYSDLAGVLQTVASSVYRVDCMSDPARISLALNQIWPIALHQSQTVKIQAVVGYGPCTTIAAAIAAGTQTVTPASMYGIYAQDLTTDPFYPGTVLSIGDGQNREIVTVTAATPTTFTATFAMAHSTGSIVRPGLPETIIGEMEMLISHWYTNRDAVVGGSYSEMPLAAEAFHWLNWNGEYR